MTGVLDHSADRERSTERAESFLQLIERARRGKLKVYLGYGPGVGKTYRMLEEAHALNEQGVDVVVGYVEDHGRAETQRLVEELEVVPRRREAYKGLMLEEMDGDAVLERKPTIVLVDELAHTNAPGSRNQKRYQDVLELLEAGIHVITTLNVQHLESLYDTVERLVGVKVKERLPDWVLDEADQVVNIDLSAEDLLTRMEAGKIYPEERIQTSLANFFQRQNLEHLRNLTLREIAAHIEEKGRTSPIDERIIAPDQVMVCLSSRGPDSAALLRYASRLAGRLNRNWYALYVQTPAESPEQVEARTQRVLSDTLTLAHQLGATVFTFQGADVVETILRFADEYSVGHIVIGRSGPLSWWKRLFGRRTVIERLLEGAQDKAVAVIDTGAGRRDQPPRRVGQLARPPDISARPPDRPVFSISDHLSEDQVVVWQESVSQEQVLAALLERALRDVPGLDYTATLEKLRERERQGSTFLDEGVAFPHLRVDGLDRPAFALGLPHAGIRDVPARQPVEVVWLFLLPAQGIPGFMPTAAFSRMVRDRAARRELVQAREPAAALRTVQAWERRHTPAGRSP